MSLKTVYILCSVVLVVVQGAAIYEEFNPEQVNEYELQIGDFEPIPLRLQVREKRQNRQRNDRGSVSVDVNRPPGGGTTLNAEGRANVYTSPNGRTTVDAQGQYQRHYGGQSGTSRPNYNVGVGVTHRF